MCLMNYFSGEVPEWVEDDVEDDPGTFDSSGAFVSTKEVSIIYMCPRIPRCYISCSCVPKIIVSHHPIKLLVF